MFTDYSPNIPYEREIPRGVTPGYHLNVNGFIPPNGGAFSINLKCNRLRAGYPEPNNAFHFNPRFEAKAVVRNTFNNSAWGPEERGGGFPFKANSAFQVDIFADAYSFRVNVNGTFFTEYKYRLPLNTVKFLRIEGNVIIYQINSKGPQGQQQIGFKPPKPSNNPPPYTPYPTQGLPIFLNTPCTPTTITIPGNMQPGMIFSFSGTTRIGADRFHINWETMSRDVAFHFNPRIKPHTSVVRNSQRGGTWGPEELHMSHFPFTPGVVWHLMVKCHGTHYEVSINGQPFTNFNHRLQPINMVNCITIDGQVDIHWINISY